MLEQNIQNHISKVFEKNTQKSILDFMEFLSENKLTFERGAGYWKDKFYLLVKHEEEIFITCLKKLVIL